MKIKVDNFIMSPEIVQKSCLSDVRNLAILQTQPCDNPMEVITYVVYSLFCITDSSRSFLQGWPKST